MNDLARQTLCELIATHGKDVCDDPKRCEGLLRDFCGSQRREIFVLVSALRERVPADLLAAPSTLPRETLVGQLVKRLQENLAITEDAARWTVESWAQALGVSLASDGRGPMAAVKLAAMPGGALSDWHRARLRDALSWAIGVAALWAALGASAGALAASLPGMADHRTSWLSAGALGGAGLGAAAGALSRALGGALGETIGWAVSGTVGGATIGALGGALVGALVASLAATSDGATDRTVGWAITGATLGALVTTIIGAVSWRSFAHPAEPPESTMETS